MSRVEFVLLLAFGYTLVAGFLGGILSATLKFARQEHRLVCRQVYAVELVSEATAFLGYVVLGFVVLGWLGGVLCFIGAGTAGFAALYAPPLRRQPDLPFGVFQAIRFYRQHRDHEDDCVYGPPRNRSYAKARLRTWRKVSIRPGFAPT